MVQIKVFLDSDVVISALLSTTGASFEILKNPKIKRVISKTIKEELDEVTKRLDINFSDKDLFRNIETLSLGLAKERLIKIYSSYVLDPEDAHVVAGANKAKSQFLLTHNTKHYLASKIRNDFGIIVMKPGIFLQYLRSQSKFRLRSLDIGTN